MNRRLSSLISLLCLLCSSVAIADVTQLDNTSLEKLRAQGVAIIDVRRADEWAETGLVEGSHPITFFDKDGAYDAQAWIKQLDAIVKPDQPVVLICRSGVRSAKIASFLDKRLGYRAVHNVTKGIEDWIKEKRAVSAYQP